MTGLLRICTAGSVDDGKSTLIGRLLYEARGVFEDQVRAVESASRNRGAGPIDFSLFTDGLRAEREQGITIDVAYRYFATSRRKFILADTPGHEQYTRNMATGASTADVAILLVDARHGVRPQSRRHAEIARLLGINDFVVAVNKMDLVDFDRDVFAAIVDDFHAVVGDARTYAVPVSALHGDNITQSSHRTAWHDGPPLLTHLEMLDVVRNPARGPFRFPVQLVIRPHDGFRGYAGQIVSGAIYVGEAVVARPSGVTTTIARIVTRDGDLEVARAPQSVVLTLDDEIDLGRGDMLTSNDRAAQMSSRFEAQVVWMDERPLDPRRVYLLKHTTRSVTANVSAPLELNQIGPVTVGTSLPLVFDSYATNRATGSFVLIDPDSNFTAGAGMISRGVASARADDKRSSAAERLARAARSATTDDDAIEILRAELEALFR